MKTPTKLDLADYKAKLRMQNEKLLGTQSKLEGLIDEYTILFEHAPIGYFILDKNGIITKVNETGSYQLNIAKKQLTGRHLSEFIFSKSCQDNFDRHRNIALEEGKLQQVECELKRTDGSIFLALMDSMVVKDEKNNLKYFLTMVSDITLRKEQERKIGLALQKEKELNEMKSQFITIASHEFRTPLSTILTSSELIEKYTKPVADERTERHFLKIKTSIQRLKEILIDFMSAGEIERENIKNKPKTFNLIEFTKKLLDEVNPINGTTRVNYNHHGSYTDVLLDPKLLKTALTNLIVNAYKYSPDGSTIEITTEQNSPGNINITIKDNGIGIPLIDQPHLFETFFRAKNADNIPGTGLGLNITKKLITLMEGNISFRSKENEGTTFFINFYTN